MASRDGTRQPPPLRAPRSTRKLAPMNVDKLTRNMASAAFARAILGDRCSGRPEGGEPPLKALPVDDTPWVCGVVLVELETPLTNKRVKAPFYFLAGDLEIMSIEAAIGDGASAHEAVTILFDAMHAPLMGDARRPRRVLVPDAKIADAMRAAARDEHPEMNELVEFAAGPTDDDTFLELQRLAGAEDEADAKAAMKKPRPSR